jgi:predicted DCC family thiol-disulfide oxidoreductase YuxK
LRTPATVHYDGRCGFCRLWVERARRLDTRQDLSFVPLGSAPTPAFPDIDSVVVTVGEQVLVRSDAVIEILSRLQRPWCWLGWSRIVPRPLRDGLYELVARNRHRLGGSCRI